MSKAVQMEAREDLVKFPEASLLARMVESPERASLVAQMVESACNAGDLGSIPGSGRSPGEGNGNPLQYSCLENPMDRRAW